ncbi:hypothetical protein Tsubulata_036761 [Turnera subulata]|uniref:RCC1-like domain-containing protein n=1 Tax=Turnera subulata TaxID=218843 RepID=A0A9Q0GJB1_9ROSI|nr:hypothetical protein Tsubulata_036761 [Turnera subulata]
MLLPIRAVTKTEKILSRFFFTRRLMSSGDHRKTEVYSFGDSSQGALGHPYLLTQDAYTPESVGKLPEDVVSIAAGHYHSLAVTSQGHLWAWGRNEEAQLGQDEPVPRNEWQFPRRVKGLDDVKVSAAFASGVVSAAIGDGGSLWVWGKSKRGQLGLGDGVTEATLPCRVEALAGEKIAKVSFGWGHALAQTQDGKLFGWGYTADGRIGRLGGAATASPLDSGLDVVKGDQQSSGSRLEVAERLVLGIEKEKDMPTVWNPSLVEELHGVEVTDIACGLDHSLVLCRDGTLLSAGSNVYGQLGRVNRDLGLFPVDIRFCPLSVASGLGHSLAICRISSDGDVREIVSWGWNQLSQLGRSGPANTPLEVEGLLGETPISVSGGRVHTIALTAEDVWVWGCGKNGRLGLGSSTDEAEPFPLDWTGEVLQVVSGFDHSLILVAREDYETI